MAAVKRWDEETNTAAAKQCDEITTANEEANVNAVGHVEMQGAINLLSFRTDAAAMAAEKRMNLGGSLKVTMRPESSQRRMVIETRPVRELNTLKGEMGETTDGDQSDGWVERERRGDWGHLYGPECCSVWGQNPFRVWMLGCELRKQVGEKAAGKTAGLDLVDHLKEFGRKWRKCRFGSRSWNGLCCGKAVDTAVVRVGMNGLGGTVPGGS